MHRYGLIGKTLGHSWSQRWFEDLFEKEGLKDYSYGLYELPSLEGLKEWTLRENLAGFNVTTPYKQAILPHLDALDPVAEAIGAVNCITVEDNRLIGHNTDAPAFCDTLSSFISHHPSSITQSFILGTGGAAHAVAYALEQLGIPYTFVSRHPDQHTNAISYDSATQSLCHLVTNSLFIINATPVGMFPDIDHTPLDLSSLHSPFSTLLFYDLIYNPSPTLLLHQAAAHGAHTKDGLEMLHLQARLSWELWNKG